MSVCVFVPAVKPSMPETTALGAAMAAGAAEGVSVWSLSPEDLTDVTSEKFEPQINPEGKNASAIITARNVLISQKPCIKGEGVMV